MKLLPLSLDVRGRACLVVGGGPIGARKLASLLECQAQATLISPAICEAARPLAARCKYLQRAWQGGDCRGFALIWACTPRAEVNEAIAREARDSGAWCAVSGAGEGGDLHSMAAVRRGEVCIGIASGGAAPALSRHLRERIEAAIGGEYEVLLSWMSEERAELKARLGEQGARAEVWREVLASEVLELLRSGRQGEARARFEAITRGSSSGSST